MAVNKVVYKTKNGTQTLIDLTGDTVTPETLAEGVIAHNAKGEIIIGTAKIEKEPVVTNNLANPSDSNWLLNKRYNSSLTLTNVDASVGAVVTNVIDVRNIQSYVRIENLNIKTNDSAGTFQGRIYHCTADGGTIMHGSGSMHTWPDSNGVTYADGVSTIKKKFIDGMLNEWGEVPDYIRIGGWLTNGPGTSDDVIITIDSEPIMG